ncbi:MAG: hypothetical protein TE42_01605 [Candidatus Synechococcus spongiarum SP3]|uniref:Uncharacterized protein n=1 Tax=Candidatus Synechococcus spongiarum SP3 TaxID=1604020 RepID=A0A0G2HNG2_9SYNE|nr:MAG: hypothetical protein TE42_01605 [Candidatus Synechococcus spongiarum SP3]
MSPELPSRTTVEDDGEGMTVERLRSAWLIPEDDSSPEATPVRREGCKAPASFARRKGPGQRFAVHKLGNHITLVARAQDADECVVEIDWSKLLSEQFLDDAPVTIQVRRPKMFFDNRTGARIESGSCGPAGRVVR